MKSFILLALMAVAAAQDAYPVLLRNNSNVYVGFGQRFYGFQLPDLSLAFSQTYADFNLSFPAALQGNTAVFSDGINGIVTLQLSDNGTTFERTPNTTPPFPAVYESTVETDTAGNIYTFYSGTDSELARINKTNNVGSFLASVALPNSDASQAPHNLVRYFRLQGDQLYIVAATQQERGGQDFDFYIVNTDSLTITTGPIRLPNSANSGCPVPIRQCSPFETIAFDVSDGQLVYLYGNGVNGRLQATISAYTPSCGFSSNTFGDDFQPQPTGSGSCGATPSNNSTSNNSTSNNPTSNNPTSNNPTSNNPTSNNPTSNNPTSNNPQPSGSGVDTGDCPNGCGTGLNCCGGQCYSTSRYTCFSQTGRYQLCPAGTQLCGKDCYSTSSYTCFGQNKLCPAGTQPCGEACYNTNFYSCNNGVLASRS